MKWKHTSGFNVDNSVRIARGDEKGMDTIGAMAGAIWGAYNGLNNLSRADIEKLESAFRIEQLSIQLHNKYLTFAIATWKVQKPRPFPNCD